MGTNEKNFHMEMMFGDKRYWTLGSMLELRSETDKDKPFLQFKKETPKTFSQVNETANKIAHGLSKHGVAKQDTVLIFLPNCPEFIYTWFAVIKLGAIEVPINTAYKGYFITHLANNSKAKIMIADHQFLDRIKDCEDKLEYLEKIIFINDKNNNNKQPIIFNKIEISDYEKLYDNPSYNLEVQVNYYDSSAIIYTSGTTGPSKGPLITHAWMHTNAERMISMLRMTGDDIYLLYLPLFHGNAQGMVVMPCLITGAKVVLYEKFSASKWVEIARNSNATLTNLVGVMMAAIFNQPEKDDDKNNNLRAVNAYPCPSALYEQFKQRFGIDQLLEIYGMTEIGITTLMPYDDYRPDSCGKEASDFVELCIADSDTDEKLPAGEVGELLVRPKMPWILNSGYYQMPEKTAEAYRNAWFHTGDALKVDEDGYYYFVDRIKDALRKGGENISSFEVEKTINDHLKVDESAAVAVKSEYHGGEDEVKIYVVLKEGETLTPEELLAWCDDRMPKFTVPRYIEFLKALPKTPTEKVMKGKLRDLSITDATYDRKASGYLLKEEKLKKEKLII